MDKEARTLAQEIRQSYDVMFVLGIGGSYAGAKAAIEFLPTDFPVEFIGYGFETTKIAALWQKYHQARIKLCLISKSGKTFEIVAALKYLEKKFKEKYGANFHQHLLAITGTTGSLRDYAQANNIRCILHPEVGGRYSVLTVVGLFPMAVAGIDIDEILRGAATIKEDSPRVLDYATHRYQAYQNGKRVEIFAVNQENLLQFANWYQQLFGESEGKLARGMWTSPLVYSRDLHSMGQFVQQGSPIMCETIIACDNAANTMNTMNQICVTAVKKAHEAAGVPVTQITIQPNAYDLGQLFNLFLKACVLYCNKLGVNPFDQPGVEAYKNEMRKLLQNDEKSN